MILEEWKDIPGQEGKYQVSNLGRVKSVCRKVRGINPYTKKEFLRTVPERILRPGRFCKCGHVSVTLGRKTNGRPVHQLVMLAFVGPPPEGMEVLHKDGNPQNNQLSNLHYGTRTDNILDVYRQGGRWRKLSVDDVEAIRFGLWSGILGTELAKMYNVSATTISSIKNGGTYGWLK